MDDTIHISSVAKSEIVFLNVYTIPEGKNAEELVNILEKVTREVMQYQTGFRSATIHVSLEENRVMNYAIWDSLEDFQNMRKNPAALPHLQAIREAFSHHACLYKSVSITSIAEVSARS
jgi:hypothetical protein